MTQLCVRNISGVRLQAFGGAAMTYAVYVASVPAASKEPTHNPTIV